MHHTTTTTAFPNWIDTALRRMVFWHLPVFSVFHFTRELQVPRPLKLDLRHNTGIT
jgi:hypothetical protein